MKNHSKILFRLILTLSLLLCSAGMRAESDPEALADLTWVQMLNSVDAGKGSDLIQKFQEREARNVLLKGIYGKARKDAEAGKSPLICNVENLRNKEVLLITIPASELFAPNSLTLREDAAKYLEPIKRYLKQPDMWRVMLVMHTDNTGSPEYRQSLTEDRVLAVTDWFENQPNLDTDYLFPYALSDSRPNNPNTSFENRADNRRLEIYLVPGEKMVEQAKHGKIAF